MKEASSMSFSPLILLNKNGVSEMKNCTLIDMVRIMLDEYRTTN
jgi:hypothetical protein